MKIAFPDVKAQRQKSKLVTLVSSAAGAAAAIGLALRLCGVPQVNFLLASLGGSTVFLFALTDTEAAQPRALFGGHFGGALIGILSYQLLGEALWVYVFAVVLTTLFMMLTRTIHPPAGANPLLMIHYHAGFNAILNPVAVGVFTLFLMGCLWSRLGRGRPYPSKWW